jgi:hypothetical protein
MTDTKRLRGLKALVQDVVEHGSRAVERIQKETARRPFEILEAIPPIAIPARGVHAIHDASVSGVHSIIRLVNRVVGETVDAALDHVEKRAEGHPPPEPPSDPPP